MGLEPTASRSRTARASRCATPLCYGGEQRSRTSRPSWATRLAGGHLAPMQDGLSVMEEGEGVEPSRLVARPFSRRMPSPIGLSFQRPAPLPSRERRLGGSGGNCTPVLRFKRPLQPNFCYRPGRRAERASPTPRSRTRTFRSSDGRADQLRQGGKDGVLAMHPSSSTIELSQSETMSSGPRIRTWNSRFRAARPAIGPVRIAGRSVPSGRRLPPGGAPGS